MATPQLYLDLDGVMADFDGAFPAVFGVSHIDMPKKEMWRYIATKPRFFADLPPMPGAMEAWAFWLRWYNPIVLTSAGESHYDEIAPQKRDWVERFLGPDVPVIVVRDGIDKPLHMASAGDILIDDWSKNTNAWNEHGGRAVKHEGDWGQTYKSFREAFYAPV